MAIQKPARTEIWLRKLYREHVERGTITTIFRPGRRLLSEGHPKALDIGEIVRVRVLDNVGADWADLYGMLLPAPNREARIITVEVKPFTELQPSDFEGSTPDVKNLDDLKIQLGLIYNLAVEEFSKLQITRTTFVYLDPPLLKS